MLKKICIKCGLEKDINEFYLNAGTKDGYSSICKDCQKKSSAKYAQEHKEEIRQYKKERYLRRKQEFEELRRLVEEYNYGFGKRDN